LNLLPWTGERLVPQIEGNITFEHLHRYALAMEMAKDGIVLDMACGEGYGSNLLAQVAREVIGVDISPEAIVHAEYTYQRNNLTFRTGTCSNIPLEAQSVDLVVCFETIEHHDQQAEMMAEFKRVLRPGGSLVISTPNKRTYTDIPGYANPFHVRELYLADFERLLKTYFKNTAILGQRVCHGSVMAPLRGVPTNFETFRGNFSCIQKEPGLSQPVYLLGVATDQNNLPPLSGGLFESDRLLTDLHLQIKAMEGMRAEKACSVQNQQDPPGNSESLQDRLTKTEALLIEKEKTLHGLQVQLDQSTEELEKAKLNCSALNDRVIAQAADFEWLAGQLHQINHHEEAIHHLVTQAKDLIWYNGLLRKIRGIAVSALPSRATILVASKGDERILGICGPNAWHFPQTAEGVYAGHHPVDDSAAIGHLEELIAKGAQFFLLPSFAYWWLESYPGFGNYLKTHYRLIIHQEDTCMIFDLSSGAAT
jgi:ubiquinone/menaquinone biosynthesis C-methylase UbiE